MPDGKRAVAGENENGRVAYASTETAPAVPGRRKFFTYRELGVADASNGKFSAQVQQTVKGLGEATGWHYHTCQAQFVYVLKGWVVLEFENGETHRVGAGESIFIPGGVKHNETDMSDNCEALEIHMPAGSMGTVPCDPPNA